MIHSNLSQDQLSALEELKKLQSSGKIQIKRVDKGGGVAIMNSVDYGEELTAQLHATISVNGNTIHYYQKANESDIKKQTKSIRKLIDTGVSNGFIAPSDAKVMQPTENPGRLYG